MIFETCNVSVDFTQANDIDGLVAVYNSHPAFLRQHLNRDTVTGEWMSDEVKATRDAGFWSCKVTAKSTGEVVGLMDVHMDTETYLSLLMVHRDYAHQGIGQEVYEGLEAYARAHQSCSVRIDVVTGYDDRVLDFWVRRGFRAFAETTLDWGGVALSAVTMRRVLDP